jgi:signal peptidase I
MYEDGAEFWSLAKFILEDGHDLRFRARGRSMSPSIRHGDVLTIRPVGPDEVEVGDVVFYRHANGRVLVHRVTKRVEDEGVTYFLIQGDAFDQPDGLAHAEQILGKVVCVEQGDAPGRSLSTWLARVFYRVFS